MFPSVGVGVYGIPTTLAGNRTFSDDVTITGDLAVNGGDLTSTATTFNLLNANVTTLNIGGAATAIAVGATSTVITLGSNATINGGAAANDDLTLQGTSHATKTTSYVILQPTTGNVGIGTTAPGALLHVTGGNVRFGPTAPAANLELTVENNGSGNLRLQGATTNSRYRCDFGVTSAGLQQNVYDDTGATYLPYILDASTFSFRQAAQASVGLFINTSGNVGIGATGPATLVELENVTTITGAVTDGYSAALTLDPGYTAATALTVTRHNYIDVQNVSVAGAGPAAVTNAAVFRFDAAVGTHLATVGATTKTTPGGVDGWIKMNVNGTIMYVPMYLSTTA